jgi:putative ABC transport system permease protein
MMGAIVQDLRYGIRLLRSQPVLTLIAVTVLALGIGANTAIFSVVNAVLIQPLPYNEPEMLVWLWNNNKASAVEREPLSFPNFTDIRNENRCFEDVAGFVQWMPILTHQEDPEQIQACQVSASYFATLRVEPILGHTFLAEEDSGKNRVAVLSEGLWKRRYGADRGIIDRPIVLDGNLYNVVGVMPQEFEHPAPDERTPPELWVPIELNEIRKTQRRGDFLNVIARLKPSVAFEHAWAEMDALAVRLDERYPEANAGWRLTMIPLHERFTGDVKPAMLFLLGSVVFLLLIACANVANLLLVRSTLRHREIAIRRALGAARGRLIRQFLTESVVLAFAGGALGVLLALWGIRLLVALSPNVIPRIADAGVDFRVLVFTLALSLVTGIVFGLVPALQTSNPDLTESLKEGGRGSSSGRGQRVRSVLTVCEIAIALVLLIGAGLMVKSFIKLQRVNPGFDPHRMLAIDFSLPRTKYKERHQGKAFYEQLLARAVEAPGVEAAGLVMFVPFTGRVAVRNVDVVGMAPLPPGHVIGAQAQVVSPSYFNAMGIPLLRGRLFDERDSENTPGVIVINDVMAERYWPNDDPLGKRISLVDANTGPWLTVIGIVGDVRQLGLSSDPYPQMYQVFTQVPVWRLSLVARITSDPTSVASAIRAQAASLDKEQPLHNVRTIESILAESISAPRFNVLLITVFTVLAVTLAGIGVYGVISYSVSQRAHEIGIRMAIGARRRDILQLVTAQGFALILIGLVLGIAASRILAVTFAGMLDNLLFSVSSTDLLTFISVPAILVGVGLAACYVPARRALRLDPMAVLRNE